MSEVVYRLRTRQRGAVGTLALTIEADPDDEVAEIVFFVNSGSGEKGPYEADRLPEYVPGTYEKDVILAPSGETTIRPVITLKSGLELTPAAEAFTAAAAGVATVRVQGENAFATPVRRLVFTSGLAVSVSGTTAHVSMGSGSGYEPDSDPFPIDVQSYWDDVLALAPDVLWKMDEGSGSTAIDASGGGHGGTYTNSPTHAEASLITNEPDSTSTRFAGGISGGTNGFVTLSEVTGLDLTTSFTALAWVKVDGLDDTRELFGKLEGFQCWISGSGQLTFYITPAWTSVASTINLAAGSVYMIALRKTSTHISIWINGLKQGETAHSSTPSAGGSLRFGTSSSSPRYHRGWGQGFTFWHSTALTDQQILDLYNSGTRVPDTPLVGFTMASPAGSVVYEKPGTIGVEWTAPTELPGVVDYRVQYSSGTPFGGVGHEWQTLMDWESDVLSYSWDLTNAATDETNLRVQARDSNAHITSIETGGFDIEQNTAPAAPAVTLLGVGTTWARVQGSTISHPDGNAISRARWQVDFATGNFSHPLIDITISDQNDVFRMVLGSPQNLMGQSSIYVQMLHELPPDTALKVRLKYQDADALQKWSRWSVSLPFSTVARTAREQVYLDLNPLAFYELDDGSNDVGDRLRDSSGNEAHGTLLEGYSTAYVTDPDNREFYGPERPALGAGNGGLSYGWGYGSKGVIPHQSWMERDTIVVVAWCNVTNAGLHTVVAYTNEAASNYPWLCICGPDLRVDLYGVTYAADSANVTEGISQCVWLISPGRVAIWQNGVNVLDVNPSPDYLRPGSPEQASPIDEGNHTIKIGWYSSGGWGYGGPSSPGEGNLDDIAFYAFLTDGEIELFENAEEI